MTGISIARLDHLVLTVRDIEATCAFYEKALGMERRDFGEGRLALHFGRQKINLHPHPTPIDLVAEQPLPGTADLCFVTDQLIQDVIAHLEACGVAVEWGPGERTGAEGPITSVYCRDPDNNLIEVASYHRG